MKLRSVYSPKLILTAQAQFLRVMTRVVEQFSHIDLLDETTVLDLFSRIAAYLRSFDESVAAADADLVFDLNKTTAEDFYTAEDTLPDILVEFKRLFQETPTTLEVLTFGVETLLEDFQSAPVDTFARVVEYVRAFAEDEAVAADSVQRFAASKALADLPSLQDQAPVFSAAKRLADVYALADAARLTPLLRLVELQFPVDRLSRVTGKVLADAGKPLDLPRLTPGLFPTDSVEPAIDSWVLTAGLQITESGQYVEGYGDYVTEDYFLKTPQALETVFMTGVNKALEEGIAAAEALALTYTTAFGDTLAAPADNASLTPLLGLSEAQPLVDALLSAFNKAVTDAATPTDTSKRSVGYRPAAEVLLAADVFTRVATQFRTLAEQISYSESRKAAISKPFSESATAMDVPKKTYSLRFLEGGDYAVTGYFEADDYVVGGVAVGDALTFA